MIARKDDSIVGYAMTYDLENWRKSNPDWEKRVELINKEKSWLLEKGKVCILDMLPSRNFLKTKVLEQDLNIKSFEAKQKGYKEIIGEALEYPIENKASLDFHKKIGFEKIGTIKESDNKLIWGLYKKI